MPSGVSLCRLLPRFCASLGNISIYPVKRNAITRSACKKKKTKILLLPAHWSGALRRLLFTLSPLQTGGLGWISGPTSLWQLLKLTLTSALALTPLDPQAPLYYWGWRFMHGDGHSQVPVPSSGGRPYGLIPFFSFPCCRIKVSNWFLTRSLESRATGRRRLETLACLQGPIVRSLFFHPGLLQEH